MKNLDSFEFGSNGSKTQHDWKTLLDGKIYQLEEGNDFKCKPETLLSLARNQAKKRQLKLRTGKIEKGVVIQAYGHEPVITDEPTEEPKNPKSRKK